MGKLIVMNQITVNGAFEAPTPDDWLVLDEDSSEASLEQLILADALVLGRKTYEGLAVVWPQLADEPSMARFAERLNPMPKYVASRTLTEPLEWNASLIEGDVETAVPALKESPHREPDRLRLRRARALADPPGFGRRVLVLGQPVHLGRRSKDLRRRGTGSPRARRVDAVPIRRGVAALPTRDRLIDSGLEEQGEGKQGADDTCDDRAKSSA